LAGLILFTSNLEAVAQQAVPASGNLASGSGGSLSYTIGQIDYTSLSGATGALNLGVQQPYSVIANEKEFQILVFPNPAPTAITVRILNSGTEDIQLLLYDLLGRLLLNQAANAGETNISLSNYSPSTYILEVRIGQEIKTYKIIKTHNP
jgi:hypothetical protein